MVRDIHLPVTGSFPKGFLWGAATAAYQVEGATDADGRGPSIWDTFSQLPGRIADGTTGDVACDHYHRVDDDLDLLSWLGVGSYRFSISWSRWMPAGSGHLAPRGADFYDRLVDGLLARGIQPWATLCHWDLPQALQDAGGWAERDTAHRFAEYTASVARRLGDRVRGFFTLDDPFSSAFLGYAGGTHAPGVQDDAAAVRAVHHLLLGHGEALTALRRNGTAATLGIALTVSPVEPLTHSEEDHEAARRVDGLVNRLFLDPLLRGDYPVDVVADLSHLTDFSHLRDGDLQVISTPMDALGVTYRGRHVVAAAGTPSSRPLPDDVSTRAKRVAPAAPVARVAPDGWSPRSPWPGARDVVFAGGGAPTTFPGAEVAPRGLPDVLFRLVSDYGCPPLYLTGSEVAVSDTTRIDGGGIDGGGIDGGGIDGGGIDGSGDARTECLADHLRASLEVIAEGVDLRGYFTWSLMDNFEWDWGYSQRLGIFSVDRDTGRRIPRQSAHFLRGVIGNNALRQR
ncbi:MAG: beta-glucosidase [Actinomycetota bacterium]|nr:beta-glucosidase [Actinomycetota bacterium]